MKSIYAKTDDGTITLTINIPKAEIEKEYQKVEDEAVKTVEIKGFRKGKAPKETAKKHLDKGKIYEEVIRILVPKFYADALSEHKVNPIVQPEIKLSKAKEGEDWEFTARVCEKPNVDLGDYKTEVQKVKAESKKDSIWVPGKDEKEKVDPAKLREKQLNDILNALLSKVKVEVPSIIIETELSQKMSRLVDELQKLGLTVDKYLQTKNKTPQQFQDETKKEITNTYKLEFILEELADAEKVVVSDHDINKIVSEAKNEAEKKALESQKYYLSSLLRRQKTLDKLLAM